jgi:hypothetical protein
MITKSDESNRRTRKDTAQRRFSVRTVGKLAALQSGIPTTLRPDDLAEIEHCQSLQSTLKLKAMSYWFACWSYEIDTKVSTILLGNCLASSPFAVMDCPTIGNVTAQDKGEEE